MLEAAGDTEGAKEVRRKMAEQNKALKSYCDSNGLKYRSDRVRTYGSVKPSPKHMSNVGNTWTGAEPAKHTSAELAELNQYAADKGIKLYTRKPFDGDAELLKSQIDTVADLREEFKIKEPLQLGWKRMDPDDFGETSPNHQQIWINELALRNRGVTEKNLSVDNYLAANTAEGIAAHEMGHVISGKIRNGKSGLDIYKETVYNVSGKRKQPLDILHPSNIRVAQKLSNQLSSCLFPRCSFSAHFFFLHSFAFIIHCLWSLHKIWGGINRLAAEPVFLGLLTFIWLILPQFFLTIYIHHRKVPYQIHF